MVWAITSSQTVFSTSQTNPPPQPQALALANGSYIILWGSIYGGHYATTAGWYREPGELIASNANLPGVFDIDGNVGPDLQNGYGSDVIAVALAPNGDLDQLNGQSTFYQGNVWTQVAAFAAGRSYTGAAIARAEINTLSGTGFSDVVTYYDASASGVALEFYNAYANATYTLAATGAVASGATHVVQMFGAADTDLAVSWLSSTGPEISLVDVNGTVLHTDDLPAGIVGDVALATTSFHGGSLPGRLVYAYSLDGEIHVAEEIVSGLFASRQSLYSVTDTVVSQAGDNSVAPEIATLANGDLVAVWSDQTSHFIEAQVMDWTGSPLGAAFQVSPGNGDAAVTGLENGNFVVVWSNVYGGEATVQQRQFSLTSSARVDVPANFAGNGLSDILWRNANGLVDIWNAVAGTGGFSPQPVLSLGNDWQVAGVGDFIGAGLDGVLWRNANGALTTWNAQTSAPESFTGNGGPTYQPGLDWQVAAVGDFNGDGLTDILWTNANGWVDIWNAVPGSGGAFAAAAPIFCGGDWQVAGVGDFNGSGNDGILWRDARGIFTTWNSLSSAPESFAGNGGGFFSVGAGLDWSVLGVGNFGGAGVSDFLMGDSGGDLVVEHANGAGNFTTINLKTVGLDWRFAGIGDYNGDGKADILWRNAGSGDVTVWESNAGSDLTFTSVDLGVVGKDWQIVAKS